MGTTALTCIYHKGDYRLAHLQRSDGSPFILGKDLLGFLHRNYGRQKFIWGLNCVEMYTPPYHSNATTGANAFDFIMLMGRTPKKHRGHLHTENHLYRVGNCDLVDWVYVLDLDKNLFQTFAGGLYTYVPRHERFHGYTYMDSKNQPVKQVSSYKLDQLPNWKQYDQDLGLTRDLAFTQTPTPETWSKEHATVEAQTQKWIETASGQWF